MLSEEDYNYEAPQCGIVSGFLSALMSFSVCTYETGFEASAAWKEGRLVRYDLQLYLYFTTV